MVDLLCLSRMDTCGRAASVVVLMDETLKFERRLFFPRRLEAQNVVISVAASKLETRGLAQDF